MISRIPIEMTLYNTVYINIANYKKYFISILKVNIMKYKTELNRDTRVNQSLEGMGVVICEDIDVLLE